MLTNLKPVAFYFAVEGTVFMAKTQAACLRVIGDVTIDGEIEPLYSQTTVGALQERIAELEQQTENTKGLLREAAKLASDYLELNSQNAFLREELKDAKESLREIRDGEVNAEDEADKFLRDHVPSELKKVRAELAAVLKDVERYRSHLQTCIGHTGSVITSLAQQRYKHQVALEATRK